MNTYRYQRELDVPFLQNRFGNDIFSAREIIGSFVEMIDKEIDILEAAFAHQQYKSFARVAQRIKKGLSMVGLREELKMVDEFRAHLAGYGSNDRLQEIGEHLLDHLESKSTLFKIELNRLDNWLENVANGS